MTLSWKPLPASFPEVADIEVKVNLAKAKNIDTAAASECTATVGQVAAQGAESACPDASRIGTGGLDGLLDGAPSHYDRRGHHRAAGRRGELTLPGLSAGRSAAAPRAR